MFIHDLPTLSPATLLKALSASVQENLPNRRYFTLGRGALMAALHSIVKNRNLKSFPRVWLPAFICNTVPEMLENFNVPCQFYPITDDLGPDWSGLTKGDFRPGDVFVLVHYFGFPIKPKEAAVFCSQRGLLLLEDCAHGLVDSIQAGGMGTYGVATIFGLRKLLPVPNGAVLYMKNLTLDAPQNLSHRTAIKRSISGMVFQWFCQKFGVYLPGRPAPISKSVLMKYELGQYEYDYLEELPDLSRKICQMINLKKMIKARRNNYQFLLEHLVEIKTIKSIGALDIKDQQAAPWVFPFYHDNSETLINNLRREGISAAFFPTLPSSVYNNSQWARENKLYQRLVTLPVHQDISPKQLSLMVQKVKSYA